MAQVNCTVADLDGNCAKILHYVNRAKGCAADIVCFPELSLTGYPPEDLLLKPKFISDNLKKLKELSAAINGITAVVGFVDRKGNEIFNAAAVIYNGKVCGAYHKIHLPNYGVFDEKRYFSAGRDPLVFKLGKVIFGVNICEDIWHKNGPAKEQAELGARLILNINASPYHAGKIREREKIIRSRAKETGALIAYVNLIGGQDELVFDGQSLLVNSEGGIMRRAEPFKEDMLVADLAVAESRPRRGKNIITIVNDPGKKTRPLLKRVSVKQLSEEAEVYQALMLGLRDYVFKNGFKKTVIGLSGGIDSALVAAIAADALGKENVTGIFMPSRYSSSDSQEDAALLANNLGINFINVPIEEIYKVYLASLERHFSGTAKNITEENLQARIRGNILMAFSNKFGWLVLTTGNKSEMSTGYATLYGDMAGGFAVIKDVPKVLVYRLAKHRNTLSLVIPERIITKEPTAELKPNQKDSDTLPPYEVLDPILKAYIEEDKDASAIASFGFDKEVVIGVLGMVDKSEYKRRQSPPGIKITPKAFGRDRRMPITNRYKG